MSEFIEINDDTSVNISSISRIDRKADGTSTIRVDGQTISTDLPYKVLSFLVKSRSGNSEKYLKQLAQNQQKYVG